MCVCAANMAPRRTTGGDSLVLPPPGGLSVTICQRAVFPSNLSGVGDSFAVLLLAQPVTMCQSIITLRILTTPLLTFKMLESSCYKFSNNKKEQKIRDGGCKYLMNEMFLKF